MEGTRRAVAVADLQKQQEVDTTATAVAPAAEEKEVHVPKQEDTTATVVAAMEVPKQEDTTSSGAADDEMGFLAHEVWTKLEDIYGGSNLDEDDIMMKELVHELFTLFDHKESTTTSISDCLHTSASAISQGEIKKYEVLLTNEESDSPKESSSTPPVHMCLMARGNNEVSSSLCNNDDICDEDDDDDLTENIYVISKILHKAKNNALQRFQDVLAYFENCNDSLNHEQAKSEQLEHELEKSHQACRDLRSSKGEIEVTHDKLKRDFEEKEAAGMKRKLAKTVFKSPYDSDYDNDEPYEYNSGDDVEDGNKESFIEKEAQKIREKGKAAYFTRGMFRCPYCTTKPKPRDGVYEHLMSHARGLSRSADQDIKTRAEHAALLKALGPI
ncbi:hypothetical protein D1007_30770 [Hordeum vulgare]|nr:hypothetical protein D1007_30770 [Hordeum vulgare]